VTHQEGASASRLHPIHWIGPFAHRIGQVMTQILSLLFDFQRAKSRLSGASPYGVMDMAGNVWEWVNDWYDSSYYSMSPSNNPPGPATGEYRVLRGGSWFGNGYYGDVLDVRSASRFVINPGVWSSLGGFRCVRSQ